MQSVHWNRAVWDERYHWRDGGDEWSEAWGGPRRQWEGSILPRIREFLPVGTCLEIAPGYGRWTDFLKDTCDRLIVVDLSPRCIEACRRRFADRPHISCHVNDGKSLPMVPEGSLDFVFSFDSLVHAEMDVIRAYLGELATKLAPAGVGFLHHSNLGEYRRRLWYRKLPGVRRIVKRGGGIDPLVQYRTLSVSAAGFAAAAREAGLTCVRQEIVRWHSSLYSDCFSVLVRADGPRAATAEVRRNPRFMEEARLVRGAAGEGDGTAAGT